MKVKYKVIDNFLDPESFEKLKEFIMGHYIPWYYQSVVSLPEANDGYYFTHTFFNDKEGKAFSFPYLEKIIDTLNPEVLLRAKANLYTQNNNQIKHNFHIDDKDNKHQVALYSINTNNGYTEFEDGTIVKSLANQICLFDGKLKHRSVTQTDTNIRINININYLSNN